MQIECWKSEKIVLTAARKVTNPFLDVDITATFTGPDGEVIVLPGYWDGGQTFCVRFAPTSVGQWKYEIHANPDDPGLTQSGEIVCVPYTGELPLYQHGFVRTGPQGRYMTYADGTPFFWMGDTHWTFVTEEKWDESNCPRYESQFRAVVDRRVEQKFNVWQCNFRDGKDFHMFGRYEEYLLETPQGLMPNLELLQENVDKKIEYLAEKGLMIACGFSWGGAILAEGRLERYLLLAKYLVARYGAYPMIWTIAGEVPGYNQAEVKKMGDLWREVALATRRWDGYRHPCTVHAAASTPVSELYFDEDWYDFVMAQSAHGDFRIESDVYENYIAAHRGKPFVESECLYEGINSNESLGSRVVTPEMLRRAAYLCIQSGGCGYTYGCNGIWELQYEADKGMWGAIWGSMAWYDGLELPGAGQMTVMRDFYERIGWYRLRPIPHLVEVKNGFGDMDAPFMFSCDELRVRVTPSFTADDEMKTIVGYFKPTARGIVLVKTLTAHSYMARWIDPADGSEHLISEDIRPTGGVWQLPTKPSSGDWLMLITAN